MKRCHFCFMEILLIAFYFIFISFFFLHFHFQFFPIKSTFRCYYRSSSKKIRNVHFFQFFFLSFCLDFIWPVVFRFCFQLFQMELEVYEKKRLARYSAIIISQEHQNEFRVCAFISFCFVFNDFIVCQRPIVIV